MSDSKYVDAASFNEQAYGGKAQASLSYGSRLDNNPTPPLADPDGIDAVDATYLGQC